MIRSGINFAVIFLYGFNLIFVNSGFFVIVTLWNYNLTELLSWQYDF